MKQVINRTLKNIKTETRENSGERWIVGTIPYNSKSENLNPYGSPVFEVITPTAFNKTLADGAEVRALFSHDNNKVLGSTKSGTLVLENTPECLVCRCKVPNTSWGNDCWEVISRGDVSTMSFGFIPFDVDTEGNTDYLRSVKLEEVSFCVANPAYKETNSFSSIRSLLNDINENKQNLSKEEIRKIINSLSELLTSEEDPEVLPAEEEPAEQVVAEEQPEGIQTENTKEAEALEALGLQIEIELAS